MNKFVDSNIDARIAMKKIDRRQKGVGLIEVLVTVLLLATALLVLAALQVRSLQYNQSSYMRSQANILAYDIIDRMRLNPTAARTNAYNIAFNAGKPAGASAANIDLREWLTNLENVLPGGEGRVVCNGANICTISIRWSELNSSGDASEDMSSFSFSTQI